MDPIGIDSWGLDTTTPSQDNARAILKLVLVVSPEPISSHANLTLLFPNRKKPPLLEATLGPS